MQVIQEGLSCCIACPAWPGKLIHSYKRACRAKCVRAAGAARRASARCRWAGTLYSLYLIIKAHALQGEACALPDSLPGVDSAPLGGWGCDLLSLAGAGAADSLGQASPHSHSQGARAWSHSCSALVGAEAKAALALGATSTWPVAIAGAGGCGASMSAAAGGALGHGGSLGGSLGGGATMAVLGKKLRERALSMPDLTRCGQSTMQSSLYLSGAGQEGVRARTLRGRPH